MPPACFLKVKNQLNGFVVNLTVEIIMETDLSDLSDSWRSKIFAINFR